MQDPIDNRKYLKSLASLIYLNRATDDFIIDYASFVNLAKGIISIENFHHNNNLCHICCCPIPECDFSLHNPISIHSFIQMDETWINRFEKACTELDNAVNNNNDNSIIYKKMYCSAALSPFEYANNDKTIRRFRVKYNLCSTGCGHWLTYCDKDCNDADI